MYRSPTTGGSDSNISRPEDAPDYIYPDTVKSRQKRKRSDETISDVVSSQLTTFREEMMSMLKDWREQDEIKQIKWDRTLSEIKTTTQELENSVSHMATRVDEHTTKLTMLEQQNKIQDQTVSSLRSEVEHLRRESRKTFLEIRNIPVEASESKNTLIEAVVNLCKTIKSETAAVEIKDIYRVHGKSDANKPVVVEFSTREKKISILKAAKSFNVQNRNSKLCAIHLGLQQTSPIYVADHLTPFANRLYFLARDLVKTNLFKYCWTSNGKIFVKKNDESSNVLIENEDQIHQLKSM